MQNGGFLALRGLKHVLANLKHFKWGNFTTAKKVATKLLGMEYNLPMNNWALSNPKPAYSIMY